MSDNLFDRLFELFQTTDTVNWALSEEIIKSVAGDREPIAPQLAEEYQELALAAQLRLSEAGVLDPARSTIPDPIDGAGWARANHRSYAYLMEPLAEALGGPGGASDPMTAALGPLGPAISGLQAGSMVGAMAGTAMGQFDTAIPPLDQTRAYLVVPNIESFATMSSLDERQVRLWATMHELVTYGTLARTATRRALTDAVGRVVDGIDFDPSRLVEKLGEMRDPGGLEAMLGDTDGVAGLFGGDGSTDSGLPLLTVAAFLQGYGDWTIDEAAGAMLPDLGAIEAAHAARRAEPQASLEQLRGLIGLDATATTASEGRSFCNEVVRRWGREALEDIWEDADRFPRPGELTDPVGWAARTLLD